MFEAKRFLNAARIVFSFAIAYLSFAGCAPPQPQKADATTIPSTVPLSLEMNRFLETHNIPPACRSAVVNGSIPDDNLPPTRAHMNGWEFETYPSDTSGAGRFRAFPIIERDGIVPPGATNTITEMWTSEGKEPRSINFNPAGIAGSQSVNTLDLIGGANYCFVVYDANIIDPGDGRIKWEKVSFPAFVQGNIFTQGLGR